LTYLPSKGSGPSEDTTHQKTVSCGGSGEVPKPREDDNWLLTPDPSRCGTRGLIDDLFRAVMPPYRSQRSGDVLSDLHSQQRRSAGQVLDRSGTPDSLSSSERSVSATLPKLGSAYGRRRSSEFDSSCCSSPTAMSPMSQHSPMGRMRSSDFSSSPTNRQPQQSHLGESGRALRISVRLVRTMPS